MTLSSMVVSRDWQEVSVLECIMGSLHMEVAVEQEPQRAMARLNKSKIDALIVDCDLSGSSQFLRELQHQLQSKDRKPKTVPLVIMGGPGCSHRLEDTGALFAFAKPISVEQAVRTLSAARNMILDGRLRYHRAGLEVPVALNCKGSKGKDAVLVNISQGGMQIHTDNPIEVQQPLQVTFDLPGTKSKLKARAEVVWQDQRGSHGIRFLKLASRQERMLQLWLAQQFLAS